MEAIDVEEINFDEYNRQVYFEEDEYPKNIFSKKLMYPHTLDSQKRYKIEIDKFIADYQKAMAHREINENTFESNKKRKI